MTWIGRHPGPVEDDVAGRRLRRLVDGDLAAGVRAVEWDGRDAEGRVLPAGVYCVRIESGREVTSGKFVVAR